MTAYIIAISLSTQYAFSDNLIFKTGKSYPCEVVAYSNSTFIVVLNGTKQQTPAVNVDRIEFFQEGASTPSPDAPVMAEYEFQEEAKFTPTSYMEGKIYEDAAIACTPKEVVEKVYSLENKCLKLNFRQRSTIRQISPTEFTTSLYGDDYESVTIYFTTNAVKYISSIKEGYSYNEVKKSYSLYGIALSPKTLETFQSEYRWGRPVFIPFGRTTTKAIGKKGLIYSW